MSTSKVVNGRLVTNTDVRPPTGWTVNYEDMGDQNQWGEDGEVADSVSAYGIYGVVKPLFRTPYSSNEVIFIIDINGQYYVYNGESGWVQRIVTPTDLKEIVDLINEHGWFRLETEDLGE